MILVVCKKLPCGIQKPLTQVDNLTTLDRVQTIMTQIINDSLFFRWSQGVPKFGSLGRSEKGIGYTGTIKN